jgi:hypothetical protein
MTTPAVVYGIPGVVGVALLLWRAETASDGVGQRSFR